MIEPTLDWMIVEKQEKKSNIVIPESVSLDAKNTELVPFKVLAIGPGKHDRGVFVKTKALPGDLVFISGPVLETKFRDIKYMFSQERHVAAFLREKNKD